jgi:biotin transport system substrate-specific component
MTTLTATTFTQDKRIAALSAVGFALVLGASAQIAIPIPGTPVPVTMQPLVVVLAGLMLGPVFGAASMLTYLVMGAAGVPVFAPGGAPGVLRLIGPTGGYLIAFPFAAFVAGFVSQKYPKLLGRWAGAMLGMIAIFVGGISQLAILTGSLGQALAFGLTPFAAFDVLKALVAAAIARPRIRSDAAQG